MQGLGSERGRVNNVGVRGTELRSATISGNCRMSLRVLWGHRFHTCGRGIKCSLWERGGRWSSRIWTRDGAPTRLDEIRRTGGRLVIEPGRIVGFDIERVRQRMAKWGVIGIQVAHIWRVDVLTGENKWRKEV